MGPEDQHSLWEGEGLADSQSYFCLAGRKDPVKGYPRHSVCARVLGVRCAHLCVRVYVYVRGCDRTLVCVCSSGHTRVCVCVHACCLRTPTCAAPV